MKKTLLFLFATLMSVSMSAKTVQQEISINAADWSWGYSSKVINAGDMLQCTLEGEWGAASIGWDPTIDLSGWDKIIIMVENMNGCDGEYWKLKAYLRDETGTEANQMEGLLGLDAEDGKQNYLVIDLHQDKQCDLTKAKILAVQCQPNGAVFKISRVYLEKEEEDVPGGEVAAQYTCVTLNAPTTDKPENINIVGSFSEGTAMELLNTGWYFSELEATPDDTFKFCDAANKNKVLCEKVDNQWVQAIFKFGEKWEDDTWKGVNCKWIDADMSDAQQYAWKENMPEPGEESSGISTVKATTVNGAWYDLNGRLLNGNPAMKGIYLNNGRKVVIK